MRPATVFLHGEGRGGGGGQRRRVHRFEGGLLGKGSKRARERPGGPRAARAAGEPTPGPSTRRERARSPKGRQWGVGEGLWRMGEGRSRASHNNKSQSLPTLNSKPQVSRNPGYTHSGKGSVRAQAAEASAGGASVARSVPAAPLQRVPPRASGPAAAPPLPVLLPLRQMVPGSPAPSCPTVAWLLAACFPSQRAFVAGAQVACHAPEVSRFVLCPALSLLVGWVTWVPIFPPAASLNPALMSPRFGDGIRNNVA